LTVYGRCAERLERLGIGIEAVLVMMVQLGQAGAEW